MTYIYGANSGSPRVDAPQPLEQPAPLRTIGPIRAVTTPLGSIVASPFSIGADTGCTNAALRVTGGGHFTARVGIGICPSSTNPGLQISGPSNTTLRLVSTSSGGGPTLYITPALDTEQALRISNAIDSAVRHEFFGNGNVNLAQGTGALVVGTDPGGSQTLRVGGPGFIASTLTVSTAVVISSDPGGAAQLRVGGSARIRTTGGTNNPALDISPEEATGNVVINATGSAGAFAMRFQTANVDRMKLDSTGLYPTSVGGIALGTSSLPWSEFRWGDGNPTNGRLYISGTEVAIGSNTSHNVVFIVGAAGKWKILTNGNFVPAVDNALNIGDSTLRPATVISRTFQATDDVTSGNPYIFWVWKNSGGTQRSGYLEGIGDTLRFFSSTLSAAVITMDWTTGKVHLNGAQEVDLYSISPRRSAGSASSPDIYGDGTNALVLAGKNDGSGDIKIGSTTRLVFTQAAGKIIPGATSLTFRNNADSADNLLIADAGDVTVRGIVDVSVNGYKVNGTKVVGTRATGWSNWTGTATRSSVATSTATTTQCAEAIKAIIDDLKGHGLFGT